jgi:hypothetical protein
MPPPDFLQRVKPMLQSHVITVDGNFVGAAIRLDRGYRFVATDIRMYELDETIWPTLADVERLVHRLYYSRAFTCETATDASYQVGG